MKPILRLSIVLTIAMAARPQTVVSLRASAPQGQPIVSATWTGTTYKITTQGPHGLSNLCPTGNCKVIVSNVCTSGDSATAKASPINGIRIATYVDATNFTIRTVAGAGIANSGTYQSCGGGALPWEGLLTDFTLGTGPLGWLDGTTGPMFRRLALSTSTGNAAAGLANTGSCPGDGICVSSGVVTVTTTYPHGVQVTSSGGKQEYFGIWGTTSPALNTNGTYLNSGSPGIKGVGYSVTGATTYAFTAAAPAGVTSGDYTTNAVCGSNGSTFDSINGTANCVVVSQLAYQASQGILTAAYQSGGGFSGTVGQTCTLDIRNFNGGADGVGTLALTGTNTVAPGTPISISFSGYAFGTPPTGANIASGTASCGGSATITATIQTANDNPYWDRIIAGSAADLDPILYRHLWDGGQDSGSEGMWTEFANSAARFLVDQQNQSLLNANIYILNHAERGYGVSFADDEANNGDGFASASWYVSWSAMAAWPFLSTSEKTLYLNKVYNDVSNPTDFPQCSTTYSNIANARQQVTGIGTATGTLGVGTSGTSFQLGAGLPSSSIVNNVIAVNISGSSSYGVVATYNVGTGAGTVSSWSGNSPASGNTYTIYQSGIVSTTTRPSTVTTGTAQAGSSTTITLAASAPSSGIVNTEIYLPLKNEQAFITAYNGVTKVATIAGTWTTSPGLGDFYSITPATQVTGYNTRFTGFALGDALMFSNFPFGNNSNVSMQGLYIVNIASDTSLWAVAAGSSTASTTTPIVLWYVKAGNYSTAAGDCGWGWLGKHSTQDNLGNPTTYLGGGGTGGQLYGNNGAGSVAGFAHIANDLLLAPYDARAAIDLAQYHGYWFDFYLSNKLNYDAGSSSDGNSYGFDNTQGGTRLPMQLIANGLTGASPAYPAQGQTGVISYGPAIFKMFAVYPDLTSAGTGIQCPTVLNFGGAVSLFCPTSSATLGWGVDGAAMFAPTSQTAQLYRNFQERVPPAATGWNWGGSSSATTAIALINNLPTIGSTDYTTQPKQYVFQATDYALATSLTGWNYGQYFGGFDVQSRTTWSQPGSSMASLEGTHLHFQMRSYGTSTYDCAVAGQLDIYQVGPLLGTDAFPPGGCGANSLSTIGGLLQFAGTGANILDGSEIAIPPAVPVPPFSPGGKITAWSSANHGSWPAAYGDRNSQYMRVCGNVSGTYNANPAYQNGNYVGINYANRCIDELKPTGGDHFVIQWDSVNTATQQQIAAHIHYMQNGESASAAGVAYPEGHTTCPGSHGCAGLDADRWIQELESGTGDGWPNDPIPTYGLITNFLSPGNIFVSWDCPGGTECTAGSFYAGGAGHSDRVTVCAGTGSCSSSAKSFESLIVHKIAGSLTDTSLTTSPIATADGHWFGAQMNGAVSCAVVMEARGDGTFGTMSNFTPPSSSGVCASDVQYLLGGLPPGGYSVTIGGVAVAGSPFTVAANDNSVEFTGPAGTVGIGWDGGAGAGPATSSSISGKAAVSGTIIIH